MDRLQPALAWCARWAHEARPDPLWDSKYLFTVLSENGHHDLACRIAMQKTYPGHGWWVGQGYTALPESWAGDNSLNHIMFGDISAWFYHQLAGIKPLEEEPGFRKFVIQPRPWAGLSHVRAVHRSPHGRIVSDWKREGDRIEYAIEVPEGAEAFVILDGKSGRLETTVGPGTHQFVR